MIIDPHFIRDHIDQFSKKEASKILKEWIENSNDQDLRKEAVELFYSLDDGSNFELYEHLFISEETKEIRDLAGKILNQNYAHHENFLSLLEYTLRNIENIDQKFFVLDILNSIHSKNAIAIIRSYVKSFFKMSELAKKENLIELFDKSITNMQVNPKFLEKIFNIVLHKFYTKYCMFHVAIRNNYVILLNCEGAGIKRVNQIQGLNRLTHLESLILKRNNLDKIEITENLINLKILDLSANKFSKIEHLDSLKSLIELNLEGNNINEINSPLNLPNLERLFLNSNNLSEIKNLENLKNLKLLNLNQNKIKKITNLEKLINLNHLNLSSNTIEKIEGLTKAPNLLTLYLNNNRIKKIEGLNFVIHLKVLNLSNNSIERLENLDKLSNLIKLEISNNKIKKIEGLNSLIHLQELFLDRNYIEKFEGLKDLESLIILFLDNNYIREFAIDQIQNLGNLNFIFLNENPLSPESLKAYQKKCRFP
jgi:Leucine-rich repeat (LRR) protein